MAFGTFIGATHVEHERLRRIDRGDLMPLRERDITREHVLRGHAGKVHGIFGGAKWRRLGQLQLGEIMHGHACLQGSGEDIETLVHTIAAHGLSTEEFARARRKQHFQRDGFRTGIVSGMRCWMQMQHFADDARRTQHLFIRARAACGEAKETQHCGALRAVVAGTAAHDVRDRAEP